MVKAGLCQLSYGYLRLLDKTVRLKTEFPAEMDRGMVAGFWHEDSLIMNLVLQRLAADRDISVIVTADERGDYIESLLTRCRGTAIRLPDGAGSLRFMKDVVSEAKKAETSIAAAMDGPLGPRRIPKSLVFYLSEEGQKEFVVFRAGYSRAFSIKKRWDHYKIPLPFTTITVTAEKFGIVDRKSGEGKKLKNTLQSGI